MSGQVLRLMVWVAPSSFASASVWSLPPTAMIFAHPAIRAAMMALMPTVPQPNTAIDEPNSGLSALSTVPAPVWMPQPIGATTARSTSSYGTLTALWAATTAYSANDDWPKNIDSVLPFWLRREVPSGRTPPKLI